MRIAVGNFPVEFNSSPSGSAAGGTAALRLSNVYGEAEHSRQIDGHSPDRKQTGRGLKQISNRSPVPGLLSSLTVAKKPVSALNCCLVRD
jgi:hypothetical protein